MSESNSQWRQDVICSDLLSKNFGVVDTGFYVDVGASDGIKISNTKLFADRPGWRGVCVEAHPDTILELNANRAGPRCEVVYAAATGRRGVVTFRANSGYTTELSGIESNFDARHIDRITREQTQRAVRRHWSQRQAARSTRSSTRLVTCHR